MSDQPEETSGPQNNLTKDGPMVFVKHLTEYEKYRPGYSEKGVEMILEEIMLPKETSSSSLKYEILELGAGSGKLTELVAPKIPPGYRYLATDISGDFLEILKSKSLPVETVTVNASSIPIPDNSVQNILCASCLHWFCDDKSLREIHRVLVPGGKLISLSYCEQIDEPWFKEIKNQWAEACEMLGKPLLTDVYTSDFEELKPMDSCSFFIAVRRECIPGKGITPGLDSILNYLNTLSCYVYLSDDVREAFFSRLKQKVYTQPGVNPENMTIPFVDHFHVFLAK